MKILGLHHVQVTVARADEEACHAFYTQVLGLPEIPKPESLRGRGGFWCQLGDRQLHVGLEDNVDRYATKAHIAYAVDDLRAWRAHLRALGVEIQESIPIPGMDSFECRVPFGNRIEILQAGEV
ncbi:MAG: VOC family protein [Candidatus Sericytochromatia bacterium]